MFVQRLPILSPSIFAKLGTYTICQKVEQEAHCIGCSCYSCKASLQFAATVSTKKRCLQRRCHIWSSCSNMTKVGDTVRAGQALWTAV